jgi:RND family efflux transporter MFP subunit
MSESSNSADHSVARAGQGPTRARTAILLAATASAGLLAASCDEAAAGKAAPTAQQLPQVTVAEPVVQSVDVYQDVVGRFTAVQAVEIRPQVSGRLAKVDFTDGQSVHAGDPLFQIERDPFDAAVAGAEGELARAKAQAAQAHLELSRAQTLVARGTASKDEQDQRADTAAQADAAVRVAEASLRTAQINLGYTAIAAPIDGRASDHRVDAGNLVAAGGSLLTTIVSQDPIHIEFAVTPETASLLAAAARGPAGAVVGVKLEGEKEFAHQGRIDFVDNQVDMKSGVVRLRAVLDNKDGRFAPGQFVRVRYSTRRIDRALIVPDTVVSSDQSFKYVLIVNDKNVVEPRPIVAGPVVDGKRIVEGGLEGKERVIIGGGQTAYPGMQVVATPGPVNFAAR